MLARLKGRGARKRPTPALSFVKRGSVLRTYPFRNGSSPRSRGSRKYSPSHTKTPRMRGE